MEQNAQDVNEISGPDMGVAYVMAVKARRFYKKGVRHEEHKYLLEMVVITDDKGNTVGRIASDMSGGFVISDDKNEEQWHVPARELWDNYLAMRETMTEEDK